MVYGIYLRTSFVNFWVLKGWACRTIPICIWWDMISLDESDENNEMLDAFVSRYSRLQDTLGDKLLPVLLRASLEKYQR